jgi:hypothetical protein
MTRKLSLSILRLFSITVGLLEESQRFGRRLFLPKVSLIAENLFLRKQLAFCLERNVRPQRLTDSARLLPLFWSRWFDWRNALVVVKPEALIAWQRRAFQLFWRWKCRGLCGRPRLPKDLRVLISEMVRENPTWGQSRVAAELSLKLGISVSPRTVRAHWPEELEPNRSTSQRWTTFIRSHARVIIACDFVVTSHSTPSYPLYICSDGGWQPEAPARQCDSSPQCFLDFATTPRSDSGRTCLPLAGPRPVRHILRRIRQILAGVGSHDPENSWSSAKGQRLL